jgi:acyl-CoA reductase-like NAD-dependent aldehyde dehydrogenase
MRMCRNSDCASGDMCMLAVQVKLANDCAYGLGAYCFARRQERAEAIGRQLRSGMFVVNDYASNAMCQSLPFGGVKESGFDRRALLQPLLASVLELVNHHVS